jgi:DNA-binding MurR/RpiR family transcriptional regulator
VFIFSHSGKTKESINLARQVKNKPSSVTTIIASSDKPANSEPLLPVNVIIFALVYIFDYHMQLSFVTKLTSEDCVFIFSHSGKTKESINLETIKSHNRGAALPKKVKRFGRVHQSQHVI